MAFVGDWVLVQNTVNFFNSSGNLSRDGAKKIPRLILLGTLPGVT